MIYVTSIVAAVGAGLLLDRLNFPAGALIGAMVAIAAIKLLGNEAPNMPAALRVGALIIIGWDLGSRFNKQLVATLTNNVAPLVLVIACFLDHRMGAGLDAVEVRSDGPRHRGARDVARRPGPDGSTDV